MAGVAIPEEGALATTDAYTFALDIDGVLTKGGEAILEAIQAMEMLNGDNEYKIKSVSLCQNRGYYSRWLTPP
jgi:ribonucleotide monophosphatase NagD (HAD superfamily)